MVFYIDFLKIEAVCTGLDKYKTGRYNHYVMHTQGRGELV